MSKNNYRVSSVSYEAIKSEAAELEIEPGVYLNATGTAEKAPYLLRVIPKEKLELDAFCQGVAKLTGHTFEETRRENDIRMEVIAEAAAEGYTYIDTGYITFELRIAGSIDSTTAAPTREANPVYLAAYPSRELAASLGAINAKLSKASAPFAISTVWGKDSHDRFITSGGAFQVNGTGFDKDFKPALALVFADGTAKRAEVESWKPSYIRASAPIGRADAKTVKLEVTSLGKDGEEVTVVKENVPFKYAVEPGPHIESLKSRATRGEGEWRVFADVFDIEGYGFDPDTTATLRLVKRATGQEAAKVNSQTSGYNVLKRESDEKLVFTLDRNSSAEPDGSWLDDVTYDAELVLTNAKGTTKLVLNRVED